MEIKTKEHFQNLRRIFKQDGLVAALSYDGKVTRIRHISLNILLSKGPSYHEITRYGKHTISHYDGYGLLTKLRLNPEMPQEFHKDVKWDFEYF